MPSFTMARDSISEAVIARILEAAGMSDMRFFYFIERLPLARCLELCVRYYRDAVRFRSDRNEKTAFRHLEKTRKAAKRLQTMLAATEIGQWPATSTPSLTYYDITKRLVHEVDIELTRQRELEKAYADTFKKYAPIDWLVGVYLADVYKVIFRKEPSISENDPYVRLAESVLRELNITKTDGTFYKATTISRSLRNVRTGHLRRKTAAALLEYSHWSFSRVADMYGSFPPIIHPKDVPNRLIIQIAHRDKAQKFIIETHDHSAMGELLVRAHEALAKGEIPPGCKVVEIIEPGND